MSESSLRVTGEWFAQSWDDIFIYFKALLMQIFMKWHSSKNKTLAITLDEKIS